MPHRELLTESQRLSLQAPASDERGMVRHYTGVGDQWNVMVRTPLCRAFLARRRGGRRFQVRDGVGRRGGGLKMGWTKPLYDARPMGVEWFAESRM